METQASTSPEDEEFHWIVSFKSRMEIIQLHASCPLALFK
jgi:hypothetical protein